MISASKNFQTSPDYVIEWLGGFSIALNICKIFVQAHVSDSNSIQDANKKYGSQVKKEKVIDKPTQIYQEENHA